jgi:hypothetical protein
MECKDRLRGELGLVVLSESKTAWESRVWREAHPASTYLTPKAKAIGQLGEALAAPEHVLVDACGRALHCRRGELEEKGHGTAVEGAVFRPRVRRICSKQATAFVSD